MGAGPNTIDGVTEAEFRHADLLLRRALVILIRARAEDQLDLRAMIKGSGSWDEFLGKLNRWADDALVESHSRRWAHDRPQGRYSLPENLQVKGD